jgi:egghead protein (zeste-white 4 protein)
MIQVALWYIAAAGMAYVIHAPPPLKTTVSPFSVPMSGGDQPGSAIFLVQALVLMFAVASATLFSMGHFNVIQVTTPFAIPCLFTGMGYGWARRVQGPDARGPDAAASARLRSEVLVRVCVVAGALAAISLTPLSFLLPSMPVEPWSAIAPLLVCALLFPALMDYLPDAMSPPRYCIAIGFWIWCLSALSTLANVQSYSTRQVINFRVTYGVINLLHLPEFAIGLLAGRTSASLRADCHRLPIYAVGSIASPLLICSLGWLTAPTSRNFLGEWGAFSFISPFYALFCLSAEGLIGTLKLSHCLPLPTLSVTPIFAIFQIGIGTTKPFHGTVAEGIIAVLICFVVERFYLRWHQSRVGVISSCSVDELSESDAAVHMRTIGYCALGRFKIGQLSAGNMGVLVFWFAFALHMLMYIRPPHPLEALKGLGKMPHGLEDVVTDHLARWLGKLEDTFRDPYQWFCTILQILCSLPIYWNVCVQLWYPPTWQRRSPTVNTLLKDDADEFVLHFRYVTRGGNPNLVSDNVAAAKAVLEGSELPPERWCIEVVTDTPCLYPSAFSERVYEICVPEDYVCPNGGKYKARALHYAVTADLQVPIKPCDWVVHLDEETNFDVHTVGGVFAHCQREYRAVKAGLQKQPKIGQGIIVYNYGCTPDSLLTALADVARVSDDFGRFRHCFEYGRPLIGMHGSFVVCAQSVELSVGYDHGVNGSITEDSYFAQYAWAHHDIEWSFIHAFMYEQSPFCVMDFVKQRARWFHGIWLIVWSPEIPWRCCFLFFFAVLLWAVAGIWNTWSLFVYGVFGMGGFSFQGILWSLAGGLGFWQFLVGFLVSVNPYIGGWDRWFLRLWLLQILTIFCAMMEVGGVILGAKLVWDQRAVFHIVQKEREPAKDNLDREVSNLSTKSSRAMDMSSPNEMQMMGDRVSSRIVSEPLHHNSARQGIFGESMSMRADSFPLTLQQTMEKPLDEKLPLTLLRDVEHEGEKSMPLRTFNIGPVTLSHRHCEDMAMRSDSTSRTPRVVGIDEINRDFFVPQDMEEHEQMRDWTPLGIIQHTMISPVPSHYNTIPEESSDSDSLRHSYEQARGKYRIGKPFNLLTQLNGRAAADAGDQASRSTSRRMIPKVFMQLEKEMVKWSSMLSDDATNKHCGAADYWNTADNLQRTSESPEEYSQIVHQVLALGMIGFLLPSFFGCAESKCEAICALRPAWVGTAIRVISGDTSIVLLTFATACLDRIQSPRVSVYCNKTALLLGLLVALCMPLITGLDGIDGDSEVHDFPNRWFFLIVLYARLFLACGRNLQMPVFTQVIFSFAVFAFSPWVWLAKPSKFVTSSFIVDQVLTVLSPSGHVYDPKYVLFVGIYVAAWHYGPSLFTLTYNVGIVVDTGCSGCLKALPLGIAACAMATFVAWALSASEDWGFHSVLHSDLHSLPFLSMRLIALMLHALVVIMALRRLAKLSCISILLQVVSSCALAGFFLQGIFWRFPATTQPKYVIDALQLHLGFNINLSGAVQIVVVLGYLVVALLLLMPFTQWAILRSITDRSNRVTDAEDSSPRSPVANRKETTGSFSFKGEFHLASLDFARLSAVMGVVASNVYRCQWGAIWISFLFVLSGFVITCKLLVHESKGQNKPTTLILIHRRLVRLYPLHLLVSLVFLCVRMSSRSLTTEEGFSFPLTLVLAQAWYPPAATHWNYPAWFLSVLLSFTIVFNVMYSLINQISQRFISLGLLTICLINVLLSGVISLFASGITSQSSWVDTWPPMYLLPFVFGMLLARSFVVSAGGISSHVSIDVNLAPVFQYGATLGYIAIWLIARFCPEQFVTKYYVFLRTGCLMPLFALIVLGLSHGRDPLARLFRIPLLQWLGGCAFSVCMLQDFVFFFTRWMCERPSPFLEGNLCTWNSTFPFVLLVLALIVERLLVANITREFAGRQSRVGGYVEVTTLPPNL